MLLRIVEAGRGKPPLVVHVIEILAVVGNGVGAGEDRWRHEKCIAPPPEQLVGIIGANDETVHDGLGISKVLGLAVCTVKIEISLAESLIVGVWKAILDKLPVI